MKAQSESEHLELFAREVWGYQKKLGLHEATFYVTFRDPHAKHSKSKNVTRSFDGFTAYCDPAKAEYSIYHVSLSPHAGPEFYPYLACHEVLHARFFTAQRLAEEYEGAVGELLWKDVHTAIDWTAMAMTGTAIPERRSFKRGVPPWVKADRWNGALTTDYLLARFDEGAT